MSGTPTSPRLSGPVPGPDALQSLLAFSFLHQQARDRRKSPADDDGRATSSLTNERFALDEALSLVAERALALVRAEGIAIALAESGAIVCRASKGQIAPDPGVRLNPESGFSGECLTSGQTIRCDDADHDPRVDAKACQRLRVRSMIAVPISARRRVIGLIEAFSARPNAFCDADIQRLELLAELILAAVKPDEEDRMAEIARQVIPGPAKQEKAEVAEVAPPVSNTTIVDPKQAEVVQAAPVVGQEQNDPSPVAAHASSAWVKVAVVSLVLAPALGTGAWWKLHQKPVVAASLPQTVAAPVAGPVDAAIVPSNANPTEPASTDAPNPIESEASPAAMSQVTGIRHWSSPDSSTVVIDLQDQVPYEAHRLSGPERIYFDLHDTKLASGLQSKAIEINDGYLLRVRAAQQTEGITRIVLETRSTPNFSVSLEQNPYRLVVEVRSLTSKPAPRSKVDLFGPSNAPAITDSLPSARSTAGSAVTGAPRIRVALDAGHGGWDLGTVGRKGLLEKDLVLDIVARLGKLVENRLGAEVVYTRKDDTYLPLENRTQLANLAHADLFLSVHANYSDYVSARGVETYYTNTYSSVRARSADDTTGAVQDVDWTNVDIRGKVTESKRFASLLQTSLYQTLAGQNPGLRNRGVKEASYVVLTGATMPAVLAEVSFVSSPTDETKLQDESYRQQIAEALYKGIAGYANTAHRVQMAKASTKPAGR